MPKKQKKSQEKIGERGEKAAARYLELMGFKILDRNWSCPAGEADIVAKDGDDLVFVTVKTRTDITLCFPTTRPARRCAPATRRLRRTT